MRERRAVRVPEGRPAPPAGRPPLCSYPPEPYSGAKDTQSSNYSCSIRYILQLPLYTNCILHVLVRGW